MWFVADWNGQVLNQHHPGEHDGRVGVAALAAHVGPGEDLCKPADQVAPGRQAYPDSTEERGRDLGWFQFQ